MFSHSSEVQMLGVKLGGRAAWGRSGGWGTQDMPMYVYSTAGDPVGFLHEMFIYDLKGQPLGRILGSRVHRLDGSYVGEWFKEMVVDRPSGRRRAIPPIPHPPSRPSPGSSYSRRGIVHYGYPDAFHLLCEVETAEFSEAAE